MCLFPCAPVYVCVQPGVMPNVCSLASAFASHLFWCASFVDALSRKYRVVRGEDARPTAFHVSCFQRAAVVAKRWGTRCRDSLSQPFVVALRYHVLGWSRVFLVAVAAQTSQSVFGFALLAPAVPRGVSPEHDNPLHFKSGTLCAQQV